MKKSQIISRIAIFAFCALCFTLAFSADWLKMHFFNINIEQILFHLRFPLISKSTPFIKEFCIEVLFPSFGLALLVIFLRKIALQVALSVVICASCIYIAEDKFEILMYLEQQKIVSNLYENYYVKFDSANLAQFTPTQNLIVIFAESLESTFSSANIPNRGGAEAFKIAKSTESHTPKSHPNLLTLW